MTQFHHKNCVLILTKILLCRIIKLLEVIYMKTYCLTVVFSPDCYYSVSIPAKSLKEAIMNLKCYLPSDVSGDYTIAKAYTLISDGKTSLRTMSKLVKGYLKKVHYGPLRSSY